MRKYFGTDGIRGKARVTLMPELAYKVGQGLALLGDNLVIWWDTRESSAEFVENIKNGALSVGINVYLLGVIPTPGLIFASKQLSMLGVMITASHNPYYDNGIKVIKNGYKISEEEKQKIESYLDGKINVTINNKGKEEQLDYREKYISFLLEHASKTDLKIVLDTANGAGSSYAHIYEQFVSKLCVMADEPNGYNINNGVGATHLEAIKEKVIGYDLGIAIDGDGDRIMVVDEKNTYDGDQLIYVFAKYFKKKGMLNHNTVVLTKMSNLGIINKLDEEGIKVVLTDVGDQNVIDEMEKNNYSLGGENSGHIITPFLTTGDGLLNGLVLLTILEEEKLTIEELVKDVKMYHDKMVNINVNDKKIVENKLLVEKIKKINEEFGKYGKVILRASGTENLIRLSVMHREAAMVDKYIEELMAMVNTLNEG